MKFLLLPISRDILQNFSGINRLILPYCLFISQNFSKWTQNLAKLVFKSPYICEVAWYCAKLRESYTNFANIEKICRLFIYFVLPKCCDHPRKKMPQNWNKPLHRILIAQIKRLMFSLSIHVYRRIIIVFKCWKVRPPLSPLLKINVAGVQFVPFVFTIGMVWVTRELAPPCWY